MKRLLQLGFVLGLAGTLAAAYFAPWYEYQRYRSVSSVVANGGRVEQFLIRLPADRIGAPIAVAGMHTAELPGTRIEHFRLRDIDGNVIGLAARHELNREGTVETAWLLTIPSRGSIVLASHAGIAPIEAALAARNLAAGQSLDPERSIDNGPPAKSVSASGEFAGIEFDLVESWILTGLDDDGQLRGTLRLNTTGRRSS
jgi:hypothetical protein